jgi:hypothetical protein
MAVGYEEADALGALRWNWEDAYDISVSGGGQRWTAKRRDGRGSAIEAGDPGKLNQLIRDDYTFMPVPRDLP